MKNKSFNMSYVTKECLYQIEYIAKEHLTYIHIKIHFKYTNGSIHLQAEVMSQMGDTK